jgi:hypothetical protein
MLHAAKGVTGREKRSDPAVSRVYRKSPRPGTPTVWSSLRECEELLCFRLIRNAADPAGSGGLLRPQPER